MEGVRVTDDMYIPEDELRWRFSTSGGPGGQHANRSATRAEVSFDVGASGAFDEAQRDRLLATLASRLRQGVLTLSVDETRSQARNRDLARQRLGAVLADGLRPEKKRKKTRASAAARRKRVDEKKARGRQKSLRRKPDPE